jgi:nucleoside-diphosphate-sugar epimerase
MPFPEDLAGHAMKYAISKIASHKATRAFLKKSNPHYSLITFHPAFVLGDSLIQTSPENIDGINGLFWQSVFSTQPTIPADAWVHVKDVADAHVKALENTSIQSGKEIILSGLRMDWADAVGFINEKYPGLGCKLEPPFERCWEVDISTAEEVLGMKWRKPEEIISDVIDQQLGFLGKGERGG